MHVHIFIKYTWTRMQVAGFHQRPRIFDENMRMHISCVFKYPSCTELELIMFGEENSSINSHGFIEPLQLLYSLLPITMNFVGNFDLQDFYDFIHDQTD